MIASSHLRIAAVAAVVAALGALVWPGCSSESDVTANCTPNVTKDGIRQVPNGCDQFAVCRTNPSDPSACCTGLTGSALADCLYGYGVGAPAGTGGGTTTTTSPGTAGGTTTSPGTGGGGGGGAGGGGGGP